MNRKVMNYFKSLDTLHEAAVTDYSQSRIVLSGCVNTFCITFELAWKAMKSILSEEGVDSSMTGSPKVILMSAFQRGLIEEQQKWIYMLRVRNDESHHYNEESAVKLCRELPELLYLFDNLKDKIIEFGYGD